MPTDNLTRKIQGIYKALQLAPDDASLWSSFARLMQTMQFIRFDEHAKAVFVHCLSMPIMNLQDLAFSGISLLKLMPAFDQLVQYALHDQWEIVCRKIQDDDFESILNDPLLLGLMQKTFLPDPQMESTLTALRRAFFTLHVEMAAEKVWQKGFPFLNALAIHCFLNEYIYAISDEEHAWVQAMIQMDPTHVDHFRDQLTLTLFSCYQPLDTLFKTKVAVFHPTDLFSRLLKMQIEEPAEEIRLSSTLPQLTPIKDHVSLKVQEQYEANPYPRWTSFLPSEPVSLQQYLMKTFPALNSRRMHAIDKPKILIAGCGTGQHALQTASQIKDADVVAIDLSRKSLSYAMRKAKEMGFANLPFYQADILELNGWDERFDLIECTGVLHHLEHPMAGLKILVKLLNPHGCMHIGLYSEKGRRDVIAARQLIAQRKLPPSLDGIRLARQALLVLPQDSLAAGVTKSIDFYSASGCRDLLFHVQEHRFTLSQINEMLSEANLKFLGFELRDSEAMVAFKQQFPEDELDLSLTHWETFEAEHPDLFKGMYQFLVVPRD